MKTIRTKVYQFNELSKDAKEKAIEWFRGINEYNGSSEVLDSIRNGLRHFESFLKDYSIDWDNINGCDFKIKMDYDDEICELSGVRLWKYLHNNSLLTYWNKYNKKRDDLLSGNCPFTGVTFDEDFLDNIREFVKKPNNQTFEELLNDAVYNTINAGCKDWEYQQSDEAIAETIEVNEYHFTKDGKIFNQ